MTEKQDEARPVEVDRRGGGEARQTESLAVETRKRIDAEDLFRLLVESVTDYAIFMLDPGGHVATWNAGAQRLKGYTANEIIGLHFSVFYPAEDVAAGKCELELEGAKRDGRFEDEGWRIRKDGSRFWANVVISSVRDKHGTLVGFSKITRDLTERVRNEAERTARLAAEQANRTKDEFLAMLGHELRNPLAPIVTALQMIKLRADSRLSQEHEVIERQIAHMVRLVDDLLDVSGIARGKLELKRKELDIHDVVARAIEIAAPLFERKHHHLEVKAGPRPVCVNGDEARLIQVFTNLLTNAAKYTEPGGHILVLISRADDQVVIEVRDDGIGIDQELLARVFELFVQGYQPHDRSVGGLGLGLALVRSLVDLHGGTVEARSEGNGLGSSFTVRLPAVAHLAGRSEGASPSAASARTQHPLRILIVDDNEDARLMLAEFLGSMGHDVRTAGDGPAALELVKTFSPEVAVLDIGLPTMDGYELAAKLRELPEAMRLIALSGYGRESDRERSTAAGFDRHLVKPIDVRSLLDAIGEVAG